MKKTKKILCLMLILIMCFSVVPMADFGMEVEAATYENAIFPAPRVYLTQLAYESYSHGSQNAIDISPGGNVFAPFTGEIVYLNTAWGYAVLQSKDKVCYADGTLDYMTVGFMHDSNISNLYKGQTIKQGEDFYQAGGMGNGNPNAYGAHVHINVFKGRVTPTSVNGNGNVFAYNAFYVNTNRTTISKAGNVASGNSVYNGAPTNYNGLWKTTTTSSSPHTCDQGTFMYYWAEHPHYNCYKCSICGEIWASNEKAYVSECSYCNVTIYPTSGATYKIASGVGNNMYLDFSLSTINVQIYEDCDKSDNVDWVKSQYFTLNHVGDGWYTITNIGNGKLVDVALGDPASGTNIQQCAANGNNAQLYRFYDAGDGYCYIKSKLGCYVEVQNGDNFNNANVWAYTFNGTNAQKWKLQSHSHSYSSKTTKQPTCTSTGVKTFTCSCGASYNETIAKTSHNSNTTIPAVAATCTKTGLTEGNKCSTCGTITVFQQIVAKKSHIDNNGDYKCDYGCGYAFEKSAPDTPTTPDEPENKPCSCNCHKGGISGFFFKLINFFEKLFGKNKVCACGVKH